MKKKKKWAELIVQVMSQLNPSVRSMEDYKTKLWQHIGIIAEGGLVEFAPEGSVPSKKQRKQPRQIKWFTHNKCQGETLRKPYCAACPKGFCHGGRGEKGRG